MQALWKAITGSGNRAVTVMGVGAVICAFGKFLMSGEIDMETLGIGFGGLIGLLARGGGTGSDAPA